MKIMLITLAMSLVTFVPRLLPVFIMHRLSLPAWGSKWLKSIPYAALGALIFPGVINIEEGFPLIGLAGGLSAAILAYLRLHVLFVILGSIAVVIFLRMYLGVY